MSATLVQAVKARGSGNLATAATTFTAGNTLIITVGCDTASGLTVSDTTHSVSATLAANAGSVFNQCAWVFFIPNITGGSTVITTAGMGGSGAGGVLIVQEFSGLATTSPKDQTATGTGSSATHTSGTTGTTTQATELVFGADTVNGSGTSGPSAISNSYSLLRATSANYEDDQNTYWAVSTARKDLTSTGTTSTAWTWTNGGYTNVLATFKEAAGGGTNVTVNVNALSMTLTPQATTVRGDANVALNSTALAMTAQAVSVRGDANVTVNALSMSMTAQAVTVTITGDVNVNVNALAMVMTPQNVSVATDSNVTVNALAMAMTPQAVAVSIDQTVNLNSLGLTMTAQPVSVSTQSNVNVALNALSLTMTPLPVSINSVTVIAGGLSGLSGLSGLAATH